jgi:hypothetical protein
MAFQHVEIVHLSEFHTSESPEIMMTAVPSSIMRSAREKVSSPGIADRLLFHAGRQLAATPLHEIEHRFGIAISESELRFGGVIGMACRQLGLFTVPEGALLPPQ